MALDVNTGRGRGVGQTPAWRQNPLGADHPSLWRQISCNVQKWHRGQFIQIHVLAHSKKIIFYNNKAPFQLYKNKLLSRVAVAEWLARPPAKQEVCGSNLASYLCWNTHVGKATGCYADYIHQQRCCTRGESQGMYTTYTSAKFE